MNNSTKKRSEHTITPWTTETDKAGCHCIVRNIFGVGPEVPYEIASHLNAADAEFIVRAVNSHEALLEAAKQVLSFRGTAPANASEDESWSLTLQRLKVAIAQAEVR